MRIISRKVILFLIFFFFLSLFGLSKPLSVKAACYEFAPNYDSSSTYTVNTGTKTLTLQKQNPQTMLQTLWFVPKLPIDSFCNIENFLESHFIITNRLPVIPATDQLLRYYPETTPGSSVLKVNPFSTFSSVPLAERITKEDSIINTIDKTGNIIVDSVNDFLIRKENPIASVPATNCVLVSGNGPRKVVFMRGKSWNSNVSEFLNTTTEVIDQGFKSIDPFKTYIDQFSFYVDLKKVDDSEFERRTLGDSKSFDFPDNLLRSSGSCNSVVSNDLKPTYFFYHAAPDIFTAYANIKNNFVYISKNYTAPGGNQTDMQTTMHEFAHAFAYLFDEYVVSKSSGEGFIDLTQPDGEFMYRNCSIDPLKSYRGLDGRLYGSSNIKGCTYKSIYTTPPGQTSRLAVPLYRPSSTSIMRKLNTFFGTNNKFNVISCGYILAAINGEPRIRASAVKYWPGCMTLDLDKSDIPPATPLPTINNVRKVSAASRSSFFVLFSNLKSYLLAAVGEVFSISLTAGESLSVTGAGFSTTDNGAQLVNNSNPSLSYDIFGISSSDTTTITFAVPANVPAGNYSLKVGAFNSGWTPAVAQLTVAAAPVSITTDQTSVISGQQATLSWRSVGATSCTASGAWSGSKATSGTLVVTPSTSSTYTLTCTYAGGVTKSDSVNIGLYSLPANEDENEIPVIPPVTPPPVTPPVIPPVVTPPVVNDGSITANPTSISIGQSSTLSWSFPNALSCTASGSWSGTRPNSGTLTVTPSTSSSYMLTCTYPNDESRSGVYTAAKSGTINITVNQPPSPPRERPIPVISTFTASPGSIVAGQSTVLRWRVDNALSSDTRGLGCSAYDAWNGGKNLMGSLTVTPTTDSVYTLICGEIIGRDIGGTTASASVLVRVTPLPADYYSSIAPSDLSVKTTAVNNQFQLTWKDNSSQINVASFTKVASFEIERKDKRRDWFEPLLTVPSNTLSYVDNGLLTTFEYIYRIRAKLITGAYSDYSSPVIMITQPPTPLIARALIKGSVDVSWADNSSVETGYIVQQAPAGSDIYQDVAILPANTTSYRVERLAPSTTYRYRVQAVLPGYPSPYLYTSIKNVKTLAKPATPKVKAVAISPWAINVTWSDTDASVITGYTLVQTTPSKMTLLSRSNSTSYQVNKLTPFTQYCYTVYATISPANYSTPSAKVCAKTQAL